MRTYPLLLVAATTLSAYADTSSTRSSSTLERPALSHQHAPQRILRDGSALDILKTSGNFISEKVSEGTLTKLTDGLSAKPAEALLSPSIFEKYKKFLPPKKSDGAVVDLLNNKIFISFVNSVRKNEKITKPEKFIAKFLAERYSDDAFLAMLKTTPEHSAKQNELATRLQDEWIQLTVEKAGPPTDDAIKNVLKLLILDNNLLSSTRFKAYVEFLERKGTSRPDLFDHRLMIKLVFRYNRDYAALSEMLQKSTEVEATRDLATRIRKEFVELYRTLGLTPSDLFDFLYLSKDIDGTVLNNPFFNLWAKSVRKQPEVNGKPTEQYAEMAKILVEKFGKKTLKQMLKVTPKDNETKEIAEGLRSELGMLSTFEKLYKRISGS
ncbi:unnamed protein product [Peronospora effusa]|uniref:RxLR effector protein n=1 Tax=Peronospora effusa TaxID=542832 RepID=A0A3M6VPX2_9STRA|nr:hypothetical protein DD238_006485 [Peronospora effusa]CAI5710622.1 unnamed protein product [Peronospora effusa]